MSDNSSKIILDLCGGTGAWSKPYKDVGYDVRVITLPEHDILDWIGMPEVYYAKDVYGILAAPPCKMFSLCRTNTAAKPRDLKGAMDIVKACLDIIWHHNYGEKGVSFWALENPKGMILRFLGKPWFTFQPWEYGDDYSKKTCLWGKFNAPKKTPTPLSKESKEYQRKNKIHKFPSAKEYPGVDRSGRRAITPAGFAKAFFKANQ